MTVINVEGLGQVEIKGDKPTPDEERAIRAALGKPAPDGKKQIEFDDAPTIADINLPGMVKMPKWLGGDDQPTMGFGDKAAALFGPLMTDNPQARQEILAKHLPGATASSDKFGNPMIDYKGKRYYTSRPGEVDKMDVGRAVLGTALAAPAAALAPVSLPAAVGAGAVAGVGQSVGEDVAARAAGGTSQEIDPLKAGVSGLLGSAGPVVGKVAGAVGGKIAQQLYRAFGPEFTDAAGNLTARGARFFQEAHIDPAQLEPQQIAQLAQVARENMGRPQAGQQALRGMLGEEFNVPQTTGTITGDVGQRIAEDRLRNSRGHGAEQIMRDFGQTQTDALNEAQQMLRGGAPGQPPLTTEQAGATLQEGFNRANQRVKAAVKGAYADAADPNVLAQRGIAPTVSRQQVQGIAPAIEQRLQQPGPGNLIVNQDFPTLAPRSATMLDRIRNWDSRFPQNATDIDWQGVDAFRRELNQLKPQFSRVEDNTDFGVANTIMDEFDKQLGQSNPLLNRARAMHAARKNLFEPGTSATNSNTRAITKVLGEIDPNTGMPRVSGTEAINRIFNSDWKAGEAMPSLQHLQTIFPPNSPQMEALKSDAVRRLLTDAQGNALSPQKASTAIRKALSDDTSGPLYRQLLNQPGEIERLQRFELLNRNIAEAAKPRNPSGSGHLIAGLINKYGPRAIGTALGEGAGHMTGIPGAGEVAGLLGYHAGGQIENALSTRAAQRAVSGAVPRIAPPPLAGATTAATAAVQGATPGPADRLMNGLLGVQQ